MMWTFTILEVTTVNIFTGNIHFQATVDNSRTVAQNA